MNRRESLAALLALGAAPRAFGQAKTFRLGFLGSATATEFKVRTNALREGLRRFGYIEGKNLVIESRFAEGKNERLVDLAAELVSLKPDVLVTHATPGSLAAQKATSTLPVVFVLAADPVAQGLVASLARPGGNLTGSTFFYAEIVAKRLEMLREAFPRVTRVAVLLNPANPATSTLVDAMEPAAKALKMSLSWHGARSAAEFDKALAEVSKKRADALALVEDPVFLGNPAKIAALATSMRLPTVGFNEFAEAGGLIGYGVDFLELWRRAAYFVDRILKGAKPGGLPVERPTKFELVVNVKTAAELGVAIPRSILGRADRVIE